MPQPLLTLGSKTEPVKLVFTIEEEKLASADEVRVAIGRERRQYGEGGMMGKGRFRPRQKEKGGGRRKCDENVERTENELKVLNQGPKRKRLFASNQ